MFHTLNGRSVIGGADGVAVQSNDILDAGKGARVFIYNAVERVYACGDAVIHVFAPVQQVFAWGDAKVHIHAPSAVHVSGRAFCCVHDAGAFVTAKHRSRVYLCADARVLAYDDTLIFTQSPAKVETFGGHVLIFTSAGELKGHPYAYRSGVRVEHY